MHARSSVPPLPAEEDDQEGSGGEVNNEEYPQEEQPEEALEPEFLEEEDEVDNIGFDDDEEEPFQDDFLEDGFQEEQEDALEGEEEPEEAEEQEDDAPKRENEVALSEVPEHLRDAVEESLKLKRALSTDKIASDAKRQRLGDADMHVPKCKDPERAALLSKWLLSNDTAAKYVLEAAEEDELDEIKKSGWRPNKLHQKKTPAEQINDELTRIREKRFPPGGTLDPIAAFKHKWKLSDDDDKLLRNLNHKGLRYVMTEFGGTSSVQEVAEEASMIMPDDDAHARATTAAPDKPGLFTLSRFNRLELIDPIADALVVGDANLSFSLLLAQHRKGLGHVGRIVATTFELIETLRTRYTEIDATVKLLEEYDAEVFHDVDCTRLGVDPRFREMEGKFGAVYYNFPHAGVVGGFYDGHPFVRWRHENLMHLFFRALRAFVQPGGSVKVSSNSHATGVRYSDILSAAKASEFLHVETIPFLEWQLRGYRRSYGDRRDANRRPEDGQIYKDQRAHSDMVYSFRYAPSGDLPPKPRCRYPPSKQDLLLATEGKIGGMRGTSKKRKVEEIHKLFLSYVEGIHVG